MKVGRDTAVTVPFNRPHLTNNELAYISHAHALGALSGDGPYTKRCHSWFEQNLGAHKCLLTHSCTAALEMMAILSRVGPGDEVIMPSYTFVSTANAFVLRGARPVFVDIRSDTLNLNESLLEAAITPHTKAIVPVHYAGVGCEMDSIVQIAAANGLRVFEDSAQALLSTYKGRYLGTIGDLGAFSFHETKNVISGEGGALLVNDPELFERAQVIREKGTNRSRFFRGQVDKYTWVDIGSSYLPGETVAAFLLAQLENVIQINSQRMALWCRYHYALESLERRGCIRRPVIPSDCTHNAHMYYILVDGLETRSRLIAHLKSRGVLSVFHYVPLHSSPAGRRYGRAGSSMAVTDRISDSLLRLPLFVDLTAEQLDIVIDAIFEFFA